MGGRGGSSGQNAREQRTRGGDGMGGGTQTEHNPWKTAEDIKNQLGVSEDVAKDFRDAIYEPENDKGGFTYGWDKVIRAYQNGELDKMLNTSKVDKIIRRDYGGDTDAYVRDVVKKATNCEKLIDAAPKWNGGELMRGFSGLDAKTLADLTTPGVLIDLNHGTASWSTKESVARSFAEYSSFMPFGAPAGSFVAHVESGTRRGTSIKNLSFYDGEDEVLCSAKEAFVCTRVEKRPNGEVHAYYDVVKTNHNWKKKA